MDPGLSASAPQTRRDETPRHSPLLAPPPLQSVQMVGSMLAGQKWGTAAVAGSQSQLGEGKGDRVTGQDITGGGKGGQGHWE